MSNYSPHLVHCILDETAARSPGLMLPDEVITEFLNMASSAPYIVTDPEAHRKGKIPFLSRTILMCSNVENLNLVHQVSCSAAVMRRFKAIITVQTLPEYC